MYAFQVIPFGNNFLCPYEMASPKTHQKCTKNNFNIVIPQYSSCPIIFVNCIQKKKIIPIFDRYFHKDKMKR